MKYYVELMFPGATGPVVSKRYNPYEETTFSSPTEGLFRISTIARNSGTLQYDKDSLYFAKVSFDDTFYYSNVFYLRDLCSSPLEVAQKVLLSESSSLPCFQIET